MVEEGPADDRIESVVSYEVVVKAIEAIVASGHVNLVETLAERIAESCLTDARVLKAAGAGSRNRTSSPMPGASASKLRKLAPLLVKRISEREDHDA